MAEWQKADQRNLGTYRGFIRLTTGATALVVVTLIALALTLL